MRRFWYHYKNNMKQKFGSDVNLGNLFLELTCMLRKHTPKSTTGDK